MSYSPLEGAGINAAPHRHPAPNSDLAPQKGVSSLVPRLSHEGANRAYSGEMPLLNFKFW